MPYDLYTGMRANEQTQYANYEVRVGPVRVAYDLHHRRSSRDHSRTWWTSLRHQLAKAPCDQYACQICSF